MAGDKGEWQSWPTAVCHSNWQLETGLVISQAWPICKHSYKNKMVLRSKWKLTKFLNYHKKAEHCTKAQWSGAYGLESHEPLPCPASPCQLARHIQMTGRAWYLISRWGRQLGCKGTLSRLGPTSNMRAYSSCLGRSNRNKEARSALTSSRACFWGGTMTISIQTHNMGGHRHTTQIKAATQLPIM